MNTDFEIELLRTNREKLAKIIDNSTSKLLFEIPKGFNNNVIWHIGHCVVSQQRLVYLRSGLTMNISNDLHDKFKIGTSPSTWTDRPNIDEIKIALLETVDKLKEDLKNNRFKTYEPLKSSMGFMINNHLEALNYTNFHEAEHTGNLQYLIKVINNNLVEQNASH